MPVCRVCQAVYDNLRQVYDIVRFVLRARDISWPMSFGYCIIIAIERELPIPFFFPIHSVSKIQFVSQLVRFPEMSCALSKVTRNGQDANRCVVIGISKVDCSGSVIYALKRNNDDSFEGDPFQLRQENGCYIWPNEKIAENGISFGSILRCRQFGDIYTYLGSTKRREMVGLIHDELSKYVPTEM